MEDEDDNVIVDIVTANRTTAEETYSLPVIMDAEGEEGDDNTQSGILNEEEVQTTKGLARKK